MGGKILVFGVVNEFEFKAVNHCCFRSVTILRPSLQKLFQSFTHICASTSIITYVLYLLKSPHIL